MLPHVIGCFGLQSYKIWVIYTTFCHNLCMDCCCFGLQSYKIWVIYTTAFSICLVISSLFWITKLQNLSDIHNIFTVEIHLAIVVLDYKVTKFEWYTQQSKAKMRCVLVVLDYKVTKFEWYTQLPATCTFVASCCFGLQSYKIWVIYTTCYRIAFFELVLFWITKLQNLSDIHNHFLCK